MARIMSPAFRRKRTLPKRWRLHPATILPPPVDGSVTEMTTMARIIESGIPEAAHTTEAVAAASGDDTSAPGGRLSYGDDGGNTSGIPEATQISPVRGLGTVQLRTGITDRGLLLIPQYPLTSREVAQAWRYLRRPIRSGPAVELDIGATITQRSHRGVATPPVVVPRRRNAVRLLLMIDRNGSMTPFHGYVDYVVASIRDAGRIDDVTAVYYHNLPGEHANRSVLDAMPDPFRPDLDQILPLIGPMRGGRVYMIQLSHRHVRFDQVMDQANRAMAVLLIGDAGAARGRFDIVRLLDTVSLLKAVRASNAELAWLNPVPTQRWWRSTAGQIARYIPMFPFTRQGLDQAVDALEAVPRRWSAHCEEVADSVGGASHIRHMCRTRRGRAETCLPRSSPSGR